MDFKIPSFSISLSKCILKVPGFNLQTPSYINFHLIGNSPSNV